MANTCNYRVYKVERDKVTTITSTKCAACFASAFAYARRPVEIKIYKEQELMMYTPEEIKEYITLLNSSIFDIEHEYSRGMHNFYVSMNKDKDILCATFMCIRYLWEKEFIDVVGYFLNNCKKYKQFDVMQNLLLTHNLLHNKLKFINSNHSLTNLYNKNAFAKAGDSCSILRLYTNKGISIRRRNLFRYKKKKFFSDLSDPDRLSVNLLFTNTQEVGWEAFQIIKEDILKGNFDNLVNFYETGKL